MNYNNNRNQCNLNDEMVSLVDEKAKQDYNEEPSKKIDIIVADIAGNIKSRSKDRPKTIEC